MSGVYARFSEEMSNNSSIQDLPLSQKSKDILAKNDVETLAVLKHIVKQKNLKELEDSTLGVRSEIELYVKNLTAYSSSSSNNLPPEYSYLSDEALSDLGDATKTILLENDIAYKVLLQFEKDDLKEVGINAGGVVTLLSFIQQQQQQHQHQPHHHQSFQHATSSPVSQQQQASPFGSPPVASPPHLHISHEQRGNYPQRHPPIHNDNSNTRAGGNLFAQGVRAQNLDAHTHNEYNVNATQVANHAETSQFASTIVNRSG